MENNLNKMKQTGCNLCSSTFYRIVYKIGGQVTSPSNVYKITEDRVNLSSLTIVRCLKCGLVYINPQERIKKIYFMYRNMEDESYLREENGRRQAARIVLKKISRYISQGKILDIGCATGFLLDEAQKQNWEAYGIELSRWAVNFARDKLHLDIFEGTLKKARFPYNYFDAVVMLDSIEHLTNPLETFKEIRRILKPNGILCVSTPDIDSFLSRILGARWWGIKHSHLYYFSKRTLTKMLGVAGFSVIKYDSHIRVFSIDYWSLRLKNYSTLLYKLFNFICKYALFNNRLLKFNFKDQIEVFVRKKRCLAYIDDDERFNRKNIAKSKLKSIVVLPAYNAAKTLELTIQDIPKDLVDEILLVDDASRDDTVKVAKKLGLKVFVHPRNKGYGANQKTCYQKALEMGAEIVVMVHPDYQYDPTVIPNLVEPIQKGEASAVFGSRMMKGGALEGGMPIWKHNANILLTALENVCLGTYLTEYHSGFRAYSADYLKTVNFLANSDGFIFDTEIIVQGIAHHLKIEEVPIKTRYFEEASTIKFFPSVGYGLGILKTLLKFILHKKGIIRFKQFE